MPDDLGALLDEIERWPNGVPVRLMQRVLALGEAALPTIVARFPDADDEEREPLWYLALLAELRSPAAVPTLVACLEGMEDLLLRVVAAEGLAKVGAAAVPALRELVARGDDQTRLLGYGALGWIHDEAAFNILLDAANNDEPLAHIVATALTEHRRPELQTMLYEIYQRSPAWQRVDLADAIHHLHWGIHHQQPVQADWRFRYYTSGTTIGVDLGWLGVSSILYDDREQLAASEQQPLQSLADIIGEKADEHEPPTYCEGCGALIEFPTGVPTCPENVLDVVRLQLSFLQEERDGGRDDLFDILNDVDMALWELTHEPEPRSKQKRAERQEEDDYLAFLRATCLWAIERGLETIGPARATLLAEIGRLADRYGIELTPAPVVRSSAKLGRNDPCHCGSGKKYKNCCLK
jgi:hypothetical protein